MDIQASVGGSRTFDSMTNVSVQRNRKWAHNGFALRKEPPTLWASSHLHTFPPTSSRSQNASLSELRKGKQLS